MPDDDRDEFDFPAEEEPRAADDLTDEDRELARDIAELLHEGRRVHAVKRYREATGADLADAVAAIDKLARRHGITKGRGCGPAVLLAAVAVGVVLTLFG